MAIVQTLNFSDFQHAFKSHGRENQFSQAGLEILFNYLEEYSDEIAQDIELDVIDLCCQYEEATFQDVMEMFPDEFEGINEDSIPSYHIEQILSHETTVCGINSDNEIVVFSSF